MAGSQSDKGIRWYLNRIYTVFSYEGVTGFIIRSAAFLGYKTGFWFVGWYVKPLSASAGSAVQDQVVEVVELSVADVDDFVTCNNNVTPQVFEKRIESGSRCYAVRLDGRIATVSWIATGSVWIDFIARELTLGEGEIYIYDSYTHPDYRGRRLQGSMLKQVLAQYEAAGYRRIGVIIAPENRSNIKSRLRSGFERSHWIFAISIAGFHWDSLSGS